LPGSTAGAGTNLLNNRQASQCISIDSKRVFGLNFPPPGVHVVHEWVHL
jgi:hypothetical protein